MSSRALTPQGSWGSCHLHDVRVHREEGRADYRGVTAPSAARALVARRYATLDPHACQARSLDGSVLLSRFPIGRHPEPHHFFNDAPPPLPPFGDDDAQAALWAILPDERVQPTPAEELLAAANR